MRQLRFVATVGPSLRIAALRRCVLALALLACASCASTPSEGDAELAAWSNASWLPADPARSSTLDLSGEWDAWLDPLGVGLQQRWQAELSAGQAPAAAPERFALRVPGPIEATEATRLYDGAFWLARDVELPPAAAGAHALLHLGQVNDFCLAWWDGEPLGSHAGGYEPAVTQLPSATPGRHRLVLMVLDTSPTEFLARTLRTVPHSKEDWYENFGGVLGPARIELRAGWSATELRVQADAGGSVRVAVRLQPPPGGTPAATALCEILRDGVVLARGALSGQPGLEQAGQELSGTLQVPDAARWSPESPALHEARVRVGDERVATRSFGFRDFVLRDGDVFINGQRRVLRAVLWQPHFTGSGGMVPPDAELAAEAVAIKAAGFDLVRAHVRPAPPAFLDACDRLGLMVLEEPAIGWVDDAPSLPARLRAEVEWMVRRDRDRACVVMWGLLNELSGRAFLYADELEAAVAALDDSRPVLRDSGGFFGGRWRPPGAAQDAPMTDTHLYPPWPLPPEKRDELASLGAGAEGPSFASEFGYGTLLDAPRAWEGYRSRGLRDAEALRFRGYARTADRVRESGESLTALAPGGSWIPAAAEQQAAALVDMSDALRSNPALDLLCLTQWRAVSTESSAGLLDPWGEARPALSALREALAPVRVIVQPARPSYAVGERPAARLVVVNDGAAALDGQATLSWSLGAAPAGSLQLAITAPPGVSSHEVALELPAGEAGVLELRAVLQAADGAHASAPARVTLVPPADGRQPGVDGPPLPLVWTPAGEVYARALLARHGWLAPDAGHAAVVLLPRASQLGELPLPEALAVWSLVLRGGTAVVLLQDPAADDLGRITGAVHGSRTVGGLPRPVAVAPAAGNFNGRVHVLREGAGARLLGRGDEPLSPVAMVSGELPEGSEQRMLTLGFLGNRLGTPWVTLPFGAGRLVLVGLPLLEPVRGEADPLREARLMELLAEALRAALVEAPARRAAWEAAAGRALPAGPPVLEDDELEDLASGLRRLDELVALADRAAPVAGGAEALPEAWRALPARRMEALNALLLGEPDEALDLLAAALDPIWTGELRDFTSAEAEVLASLAALAARGPSGWAAAWDGRDEWTRALAAWFGGRQDEALGHLDRASELLDVPAE